jgi:uncharacterized protein (TIGR02246 family)
MPRLTTDAWYPLLLHCSWCAPRRVGAETLPDTRAPDREQINAIVKRWEEAWNTHNMRALASMFHEDGAWVLWTGQVWTGRSAIEEGHAEAHRTVFRNSVQRERLEELIFVGPDVAVVRSTAR